MKSYVVYILASQNRNAWYIGVTNNVRRRYFEHIYQDKKTFVGTYKCKDLIYMEEYHDINEAIRREKQLKNWSRIKKEHLVRSRNPDLQSIEIY